jgi:hypothetical protein
VWFEGKSEIGWLDVAWCFSLPRSPRWPYIGIAKSDGMKDLHMGQFELTYVAGHVVHCGHTVELPEHGRILPWHPLIFCMLASKFHDMNTNQFIMRYQELGMFQWYHGGFMPRETVRACREMHQKMVVPFWEWATAENAVDPQFVVEQAKKLMSGLQRVVETAEKKLPAKEMGWKGRTRKAARADSDEEGDMEVASVGSPGGRRRTQRSRSNSGGMALSLKKSGRVTRSCSKSGSFISPDQSLPSRHK